LKSGDQVQVRHMDHEGKATAMAVQVKPEPLQQVHGAAAEKK
jgi:hypothetical protein